MARSLYTRYILTCLAIGLAGTVSLCQNPSADSLGRLLAVAPMDTHRVTLLNDYAWEILEINPATAETCLLEALDLAKKLDFPMGEASTWNALGVLEENRENLEKALAYYEKAMQLRRQLGDIKGVARLYNNLGNVYESSGDYEKALKNHLENLRMQEELQDTVRIARANYNIGILHEDLGDYLEAFEYVNVYRLLVESKNDLEGMAKAYNALGNIYFELEKRSESLKNYRMSLQICQKLGDLPGQAIAHNNLGNVLDEIDSTSTAIYHYKRAWDIRKGLDDEAGLGEVFNNLGTAHKHLKNYEQALNYLRQSLVIRKNMHDQSGLMEVYNSIGDVYFGQGKLEEALDCTRKYMDIAKKINDAKYIQKGYKDLSKLYAEQGDYKAALENRIQYDELRYERLNENRAKDFERKETLFGDRKQKIEVARQERNLILLDAKVARSNAQRNALIGGAVALALLTLLLYNRNRLRSKANRDLSAKNKAIERERERADGLLRNILPEATAAELKLNNKVKPERYESVTVMFTDFKSFTNIAETMAPETLVDELDQCFRLFDGIVEHYGIEKIKTIGDAYMCAAGLPTRSDTHALDMVQAANDMLIGLQQLMETRKAAGQSVFEMRIGIHTGPVVAGVVGAKKFAYDIWGDTVNTAARMEASGEPGKINVSETTYSLIKAQLQCTYRGKITAKNKGEISMYFVNG